MSILDRAIAAVAPKYAMQRLAARRVFDSLEKRRYDGASRGRRTKNWRTPATSATAAAAGSRDLLRNRSRDLVRNNPWAARGVSVLAANVVGPGIRPQARPLGSAAERRAKEIDQLWAQWAGSTQCDADGRLDFYGLQALALRTVAESGEVLIRLRRRRNADQLAVPIQLQVLEPDFLDVSRDATRLKNGGYIEQGIEFDRRGNRVAYYLFRDHPGSNVRPGRSEQSVRVLASNVRHVFREDRPGQTVGVPWLAPVVIALRDLAEYQDAEILRQKIASLWGAFIKQNDPDGTGASKIDDDGRAIEELSPGMVEYLEPGEDILFPTPPKVEGYGDFVTFHLRAVASALGITYEALTGDYSRVNFSSARMGWIESGRNFHTLRRQMLVPQMCAPVWEWFLAAAELQGLQVDGVGVSWTAPRREMVDPTREVPAVERAIRAGLMTLSGALREVGHDPDEVFEERQRDDARLDALNLTVTTDPRPKQQAVGQSPS